MNRSRFKKVLQSVTIFAVLFVGLFLIANAPAISSELEVSIRQSTSLTTSSPSAQSQEEGLTIPSLGIHSPIKWDIPAEQTERYLNQGVAHLAGSPEPGEAGNLFITGHSSDYFWKRNPYASIFAPLPKIAKGELIYVKKGEKVATYKVSSTVIVKPAQVDVAASTPTPTLTLITCYPIGTTKERFVVKADLIN